LQKLKSWYEWEYLPLLVSLVVTLLLRAWLITHAGGVLDGDEATVGVQAEHILHGERPVYFYGQANMGSLEAYLIALLFAIFGPSVWALRAEPALLSLIIVWATWRFATILAEGARLKPHALRYFRTCSVFFAAITPLYDAVVEMKTLGGYIEIFIIMLLLLLCTLRLTQRWQTGVATRELLWRWMGIGALLGLSLWVNLLAISAITTIALWLALFCLQRVIRWQFYGDASPHKATSLVARGLFSALGALPAACITAMPALLWGATNDWRNITTMSGRAGKASPDSIKMLSELYAGCVSNRVVGGALPGERQAIHFLHTLPHMLGLISIAGAGALILLSFLRPHPLLLQARQLTLLPAIFAVSTALFFLISWSFPPVHCFTRDIIGRYAAPLALVLPFFIATLCTLIYSFFHKYSRPTQDESIATTYTSMYPYALPQRFFSIGQFLLTALILLDSGFSVLLLFPHKPRSDLSKPLLPRCSPPTTNKSLPTCANNTSTTPGPRCGSAYLLSLRQMNKSLLRNLTRLSNTPNSLVTTTLLSPITPLWSIIFVTLTAYLSMLKRSSTLIALACSPSRLTATPDHRFCVSSIPCTSLIKQSFSLRSRASIYC